MGKRKKDSNRQQPTSCEQDVVMMHDTSSPKVCSGKGIENTNTKTITCCGISRTSLLSTSEMTLPNLISMIPQTLNDPTHTDSIELHNLLHTNKKHLMSSIKNKHPIKHNDKKQNNSDHVSDKKEANTELIQEKSPSSHTSETENTEMSSTSAEAAPTVTGLPHLIVHQNGTVTSTKRATQKNLDSYGTSKNRRSHENIKPRDIISQPTDCIKTATLKSVRCKACTTDFNALKSQAITMPSQSTLSQENPMKTEIETGQRKSSVFDLGKKSEVLLVSTPLLNDTQNSSQTAGPTNQQDNERQQVARNEVTKTEEPVNSLTRQSGASTQEDNVRTSTTESTQNLLSNATNHGAEDSKFGQEVCVQAGIKEMPSEATEVRTAKQHTSLDASVANISMPAVSKPLASTVLPNTGGPSKSPDVLIKQTDTHKKCSSITKQHAPVYITHAVERVLDKTRRNFGDSAHKTQGTHEIDNTALEMLKEMPLKTSKSLRCYTNTFCTDESADTEDVQIPEKKLDTEKDTEFTKNLTSVGTNLRSKGTAKANNKTMASKDKQKHKGIHKSHISICNQFSNNKDQCKVTIYENKTDTNNSQAKGDGVINHTDQKLKIIKADGETDKIFTSKERFNKVCKKKTKSVVTNNDIKIDMNTETSEKSKQNIHAQSTMHDFRSNQMNQTISSSCNKNVKRHKTKNTQNSITDLLVNATNKEAINDQAQQKKKKCRKNTGKNTGQEGNETDLRQEEYEANEIRGCKEENAEFQMDPETVKVKGKQNEHLKFEYSSETTLIKAEPNETKSADSTQACNKVSATLSKEHLTHLTKTDLQLGVSHDNSERLPHITPRVLAPKPTNTVSTVDEEAEEIEHKLIQRNIFLTDVCHVCKSSASSSSSLKKCSNCKMISYCSKDHQKEHWVAHKDLCKAISKICTQNRMTNLFGKAVGISPDEYRYYRTHCINKCEKELGRELYLWEKEMICYPQVCHTCYEFDTQKLNTCQKCHHVSYCKLSHLKTDHDIWCREFQVYRNITLYQCHHGIIQPSLPNRSLRQYAPLTGDMKTFLSNTKTASEKPLLLHRLNLVALSDIATCPLTVLFSLQQCNFHLKNINTLTIHLVGAEMQFEVDTLQKWEMFLMHLIPSLNTLKVVFVGPELKTESELIQTLGKKETCNRCNTDGRVVLYEFWKTLYHKFVTSLDYQKPDLICAFNAGLYRLTDFEGKDTWSPTIKAMLQEPHTPVVVTEYTEKELPFDLQRIQNIVDSLEIITLPKRNPFASLKPSLNFLSEEIVPVIFKNFYITVLQGEKL
jgi:splicing suppressor protein 51